FTGRVLHPADFDDPRLAPHRGNGGRRDKRIGAGDGVAPPRQVPVVVEDVEPLLAANDDVLHAVVVDVGDRGRRVARDRTSADVVVGDAAREDQAAVGAVGVDLAVVGHGDDVLLPVAFDVTDGR